MLTRWGRVLLREGISRAQPINTRVPTVVETTAAVVENLRSAGTGLDPLAAIGCRDLQQRKIIPALQGGGQRHSFFF
jgi:hypothetical protein